MLDQCHPPNKGDYGNSSCPTRDPVFALAHEIGHKCDDLIRLGIGQNLAIYFENLARLKLDPLHIRDKEKGYPVPDWVKLEEPPPASIAIPDLTKPGTSTLPDLSTLLP